jgi:hypothetical protein
MNPSQPIARYRAVSMEFAVHLDDRYVEMHIHTDTGDTLTVVCPSDSILTIKRHIERIAAQCSEIESWRERKIE